MHIRTKLTFAAMVLLALTSPASAAFWDCVVPEIDAAAGVSALAALASIAIIARHRFAR
jgi:hypothetical protein